MGYYDSFRVWAVSIRAYGVNDDLMEIKELNEQECHGVLERASIARLGCSHNDQPYVVPIYIVYDAGDIYVFSTFGKKVEWMRLNPRVCLQVDEIHSQSEWVSVVVNGQYEELLNQYAVERARARTLIEKRHRWWLNALAERRITLRDQEIEPVFFRIRIEALSGLRSHS